MVLIQRQEFVCLGFFLKRKFTLAFFFFFKHRACEQPTQLKCSFRIIGDSVADRVVKATALHTKTCCAMADVIMRWGNNLIQVRDFRFIYLSRGLHARCFHP